MAGFTHVYTRGCRDSSGVTIQSQESITATSERNLDVAVTHSTTNVSIAYAATVANLKSVSISCDIGLTIKTNSSGSPQETITLIPGQNFIWTLLTDGAGKIPFAGDVTGIFVTAGTGADGTLKIRALEAL